MNDRARTSFGTRNCFAGALAGCAVQLNRPGLTLPAPTRMMDFADHADHAL